MQAAPQHPLLLALLADLSGSFLGALLLSLAGFGNSETLGSIVGETFAISIYGFFIALPFVYLYGMPIYALLRGAKAANIYTAVVVGALPGVLNVMTTHGGWRDPILWNGTLIAVIYFVLRRRREA